MHPPVGGGDSQAQTGKERAEHPPQEQVRRIAEPATNQQGCDQGLSTCSPEQGQERDRKKMNITMTSNRGT